MTGLLRHRRNVVLRLSILAFAPIAFIASSCTVAVATTKGDAQAAERNIAQVGVQLVSYDWWRKLDAHRTIAIAIVTLEAGWQLGYGQGRSDVYTALGRAASRDSQIPQKANHIALMAPVRNIPEFSRKLSLYRIGIDGYYASHPNERSSPFWSVLLSCFADGTRCK